MLREHLRDTFAYIRPAATLVDLGAEDANRRIEGAPHSAAEILAHMTFWQAWFLARCRGTAAPLASTAAEGWPPTSAADWPDLRARFVAGLDDAVTLSEDAARLDQPVAPAIEFPPLAHYTVREALTHIAVHNAHHMGQIVTLRQLTGRWPPKSGSFTW